MKNSNGKHDVLRFGFLVQSILLTAVLIAAGALLSEVLCAAAKNSRRASELTDGVTICKSACDVFLCEKSGEGASERLGAAKNGEYFVCRFNEALEPDENGIYKLSFKTETDKEGGIETAYFTVSTDNAEVYSLSASCCTQ